MKIKGFIISGIIFASCGAGIVGFAMTREDFKPKQYVQEHTELINKTFKKEEVSKINIDIAADIVKIHESEDINATDIVVKARSTANMKYLVDLKEETNELVVSSKVDEWYKNIFNQNIFDWIGYEQFPLEVIIPKGATYDYSIDISAGTLSIKDIEANNMKIHTSAGELLSKNLKADTLEIKSSAGSVYLKDSNVNTLNINCSAGSVNYQGVIKKSGIANVSAGALNIKLTDSKNNYTVNGNGEGPVTISTNVTAGSFNISFND